MYKISIEKAYESISLHDCIIDSISFNSSDLIMKFENGFWVYPDEKYNTTGHAVRSNKSELHFIESKVCSIYFFKETRLFGKLISTKRIEISINEFIKNVNTGCWNPKIKEEYYTRYGALLCGVIGTPQKHWAYEFQIALEFDNIYYYWNDICPDKKW